MLRYPSTNDVRRVLGGGLQLLGDDRGRDEPELAVHVVLAQEVVAHLLAMDRVDVRPARELGGSPVAAIDVRIRVMVQDDAVAERSRQADDRQIVIQPAAAVRAVVERRAAATAADEQCSERLDRAPATGQAPAPVRELLAPRPVDAPHGTVLAKGVDDDGGHGSQAGVRRRKGAGERDRRSPGLSSGRCIHVAAGHAGCIRIKNLGSHRSTHP